MSISKWWRCLLASCALPLLLSDCIADETEMTKIHRDLVFATVDHHELKLDLYLPEQVTGRADPPPLVVWIHGGGWRNGSKAKPPVRKLTECGYALASISYRFTDRAIFPAQIHDCKAAIRWLRAHGSQYGYDASWVAVAGSSAGGHLALLLGTSAEVAELEGDLGDATEESSRVQAVIDYYGPSDFVLRGKTQPDRAYTEKSGSFALLGGVRTGKVDPALEANASPSHYVGAGDPPLLIFHGTDDETVLMDQSERILSLYHEHDLAAELVVVQDAGHGGTKFYWGENFDRVQDFLNQHCPIKK